MDRRPGQAQTAVPGLRQTSQSSAGPDKQARRSLGRGPPMAARRVPGSVAFGLERAVLGGRVPRVRAQPSVLEGAAIAAEEAAPPKEADVREGPEDGLAGVEGAGHVPGVLRAGLGRAALVRRPCPVCGVGGACSWVTLPDSGLRRVSCPREPVCGLCPRRRHGRSPDRGDPAPPPGPPLLTAGRPQTPPLGSHRMRLSGVHADGNPTRLTPQGASRRTSCGRGKGGRADASTRGLSARGVRSPRLAGDRVGGPGDTRPST